MKSKQKKQVADIKSLDLFNKKDELKQIEVILPQNLLINLVRVKLKEIVHLQDIIKTDELHYKSKRRNVYNLNKYSLPIVFLIDIHEGHLSLEDTDDEQSSFAAKSNNLDKGKKTIEKESFFKKLRMFI